MLRPSFSSRFKRDYKAAIKCGKDIRLLDDIIRQLCVPTALPVRHKDHQLFGNWAGYRECHIQPDWLLIYYYEEPDIIVFSRTGTHSSLF